MTIEVIFFDAGSVLFTTPICRAARIRQVLCARGYPDDLAARAVDAAEIIEQQASRAGKIGWAEEEQFWSLYYNTIIDTLQAAPDFSAELFYLCHYVQHLQLYPDVVPTLETLRERYRPAVISNAPPSMDWAFDRLDLRRYFESITISALIGYRKPDPPIYRHALDAMRCQPEQTLFIDNTLTNVEAARTLGMHALHLTRHAEDGQGDIQTLAELPARLHR